MRIFWANEDAGEDRSGNPGGQGRGPFCEEGSNRCSRIDCVAGKVRPARDPEGQVSALGTASHAA